MADENQGKATATETLTTTGNKVDLDAMKTERYQIDTSVSFIDIYANRFAEFLEQRSREFQDYWDVRP